MKIRLVVDDNGNRHLVRSHTSAGAEKFIQKKLSHALTVSVPTQQELVDALAAGVQIEDSTVPEQMELIE